MVTEADLQCPYCLLKFFTLDDRDLHRLKKCGPKQRVSLLSLRAQSPTNVLACVHSWHFMRTETTSKFIYSFVLLLYKVNLRAGVIGITSHMQLLFYVCGVSLLVTRVA